jgi:hypothetical protein
MTYSVVVLSESAAGSWTAKGFAGVPVISPVLVLIAAGSSDMYDQVEELRRVVQALLLAAAPDTRMDTLAAPAGHDPSEWVAGVAAAFQILAVVCSDTVLTVARDWFRPWLQDRLEQGAVPLFKIGSHPDRLLPTADFKKLNASFWKLSPTECIPALFARVGLTTRDQRVFISYRRLETEPLAQQLFDALTREGFDVFLDRFSIEPGVDFQRRLDQELADKSMVVLLESSEIDQSAWAQHEIDFTKRFRLGLLALCLPDRAKPVPSIDPDLRHRLKDTDFKSATPRSTVTKEAKTVAQWGELTDEARDQVVAEIKRVHDRALFRRRRYLRDAMTAALASFGLTPGTATDDGFIEVSGKEGTRYLVWLTPRPPELVDFYTTHPRTQAPPPSKGVIIGPTALLEPSRTDRLKWLTGVCRFVCVDEDDITDAAEMMKAGVL